MVRKTSLARQYDRWDKKFLWHPFTQQHAWEKEPALIVESGRGPVFRDIQGRRFIDGVSSLWVNLHGHRHPALDRAIRAQLAKIAHSTFLGLSHVPAIELARELTRVAPKGLARTFYSDNGATAVEAALKMAFQYWIEKGEPKRTEFLALKGSYHGDTLGAVSVGSIGAFHSKFKPLLFKAQFAMAPHCFRCPFNKKKVAHRFRVGETISHVPKPGETRAETGCRWECLGNVEKILKQRRGRIAAAIVEPVMQAAGGMIAMPPGYVAGVRRLITRSNVLMIADEVATGFCRTGSLFAVQQERVLPDFLCLAKALTGGYSPLAVTMTTERVFRAFRAPVEQGRTFFHGHSYTAHPLGCAVARANLRLIERSKLLEKTRRKAHLLKNELLSLCSFAPVLSVRQTGLMAGVELSAPSVARAVCKRLLASGVWLRPLGSVVVIMPPPIISDGALKRLMRTLASAILHESSHR